MLLFCSSKKQNINSIDKLYILYSKEFLEACLGVKPKKAEGFKKVKSYLCVNG